MKFHLVMLVFTIFALANCEQKTDYQKEIDVALSTGERMDSLILDYTLGMSRDEFFDYSWEINKEGIVVNGAGAEIVQDVDWLNSPARRKFYPNFIDDKVVQLPVEYTYNGWAPWNEHLVSDSLLQDVLNYMAPVYEVSFSQRIIESGDTVYYSIKANQEIRLEIIDESSIRVTFTDLSALTSGTK